MSTKRTPALPGRAPNGLDAATQRILGAAASAHDISLDALAAIILDHPHDGRTAAETFVASQSPFDARCCYWALLQHERQQRAGQLNTELRFEHPTYAAVEAAAAALRERYIYGAFRDEVFDLRAVRPGDERRGDWISLRALDNLWAAEMPDDPDSLGTKLKASDVLLEDPHAIRVHDELYAPGHHERIVSDDQGVSWLNTWTPPVVEPRPGEVEPIMRLIRHVLNDDDATVSHFLDWCSFIVQQPGRRISHAPLIISEKKGVGKDTLFEALARVIGIANFEKISDADILEGRFDFMRNNQLVLIPEMMCGERRDIMNKVKPLITQDRVRINEKNVKPYTVRSYVNFATASNHRNAAYLEDHDRRFWVVISNADPLPSDQFVEVYRYLDDPERVAGFAHLLATRDISHFNAYAPAPWTEDKAVVQRETRTLAEDWLEDLWASREDPLHRDVINLRVAVNEISSQRGAPKIDTRRLANFLRSKGGGDLGVMTLKPLGEDQAKRQRWWAVRDYDRLSNLPRKDLEFHAGIRVCVDDAPHPATAAGGSNVVELDRVKETA